MRRLQAYKFELVPTGEQQRAMRRFAGSCRFVFNKALALQQERHEHGEKKLSYADLCKALTAWRHSDATPWLSDIHSQVLQQSLKNLERAYLNFFAKRARFPRFKRKGQGDSFRFPQGCQLDQANHRIFLPKLGYLRYRNSRAVLGDIKNVTVSCIGKKWFVQQRLAKYQRRMAHKTKFSNNWKKAKARVQHIHTDIANCRKDFLHKTTSTIIKNHALVCIEDLQVANMSRSAKGSIEKPGRNVRQKSGLNRAILDQGWGEFRRQLDYKLAWNGGLLLPVPAHHTSQTCPCCGHVATANRLTQAAFLCVDCDYQHHADVVGAINILERGYRLLAHGDSVQQGRSVKWEPAEVPQSVVV